MNQYLERLLAERYDGFYRAYVLHDEVARELGLDPHQPSVVFAGAAIAMNAVGRSEEEIRAALRQAFQLVVDGSRGDE